MSWRIAGAIGVLMIAFCVYRVFSAPADFPAGKNVRFDDFDFTALSALEVDPGQYEVVVQVQNAARRVDFTFDPSTVRFQEANGTPLAVGTLPEPGRIGPGQSLMRTFVAKGKPNLPELCVQFEQGGPVGALLDSVVYGRRRVRVPVLTGADQAKTRSK